MTSAPLGGFLDGVAFASHVQHQRKAMGSGMPAGRASAVPFRNWRMWPAYITMNTRSNVMGRKLTATRQSGRRFKIMNRMILHGLLIVFVGLLDLVSISSLNNRSRSNGSSTMAVEVTLL